MSFSLNLLKFYTIRGTVAVPLFAAFSTQDCLFVFREAKPVYRPLVSSGLSPNYNERIAGKYSCTSTKISVFKVLFGRSRLCLYGWSVFSYYASFKNIFKAASPWHVSRGAKSAIRINRKIYYTQIENLISLISLFLNLDHSCYLQPARQTSVRPESGFSTQQAI